MYLPSNFLGLYLYQLYTVFQNLVNVYYVFQDTVNPFVEVSFQHTVYQTNTASGSHPCWNEEIKVDFM